MLEFWKRKEKRVALEWGMIDFEEGECPNPGLHHYRDTPRNLRNTTIFIKCAVEYHTGNRKRDAGRKMCLSPLLAS